MLIRNIRMDEWMVITFLTIWIAGFWTLGEPYIYESLSGQSPTMILGWPANILYAIAVTFVITLLPWLFTRHIEFERVRSPATERNFKWIPDREE